MPFISASLALLLTRFQAPFAPLNHRSLPTSSQEFTFVALGDNRPAGAGLPPTGSFRELLKEVSVIGPAFVLSSGDLLYGNEETVDQYRQEVAWTKPILDSLPCPFYNAPGNHEINGKSEFLNLYTSLLGPTYGKFEFGGYRFLAVCTELPADAPSVFGPQLDWLKGELASPKPTVVFHHHPIYKRPSNPDAKGDAEVSNAQDLAALYRTGGVKLVLEGHDHVYNDQTHDGVHYVIAGGAGAPLDGPPLDGGFFHFLLVHVKGDTIETTPIPIGSVEVTPISDGQVAVGEYADLDLPVTNVRIFSKEKPIGVTARYASKAKRKMVEAELVSVEKHEGGYEARVALTLPKHRATFISLMFAK
jgi:Calcineurin-like phosphoesterase